MDEPRSIRQLRRPPSPGKLVVRIGSGIVALIVLIALFGGFSSAVYAPEAQHITVVREGAPWQGHSISSVVRPNSGRTWIGLYAVTHSYPDSTIQRYYTITADNARGDRVGVDVVHVPTTDGVQVGIEGTFYLKTGFDGSDAGVALVRQFDDQFGTRVFPVSATADVLHAWEGEQGWAAFLDSIVRPVIDNELRIAVGGFRCQELNAACALVANANADANAVAQAGQQNNQNLQQVENAINKGLAVDLHDKLGADYFVNVRFSLAKVTLPDQIQQAVNDVQAARVEVAKAAAKVQQAQKQNEANALLSKTYDTCAACAQIDAIKALPTGSNVYFGIQPVVTAQPVAK
jgi:hypothetical protein